MDVDEGTAGIQVWSGYLFNALAGAESMAYRVIRSHSRMSSSSIFRALSDRICGRYVTCDRPFGTDQLAVHQQQQQQH